MGLSPGEGPFGDLKPLSGFEPFQPPWMWRLVFGGRVFSRQARCLKDGEGGQRRQKAELRERGHVFSMSVECHNQ